MNEHPGSRLANSAIRWHFVDTVSSSCALMMGPPSDRPTPATASLHRVFAGRIPRLHRYYQPLRQLPSVGLGFGLPSPRPTTVCADFFFLVPPAPRTDSVISGSDSPWMTDHTAETAVSPKFPGNPHMHMPRSRTPPGPPRQAVTALRCCLPSALQRRLPGTVFRGSITRPMHSLFTLRPACRQYKTQNSLPAVG